MVELTTGIEMNKSVEWRERDQMILQEENIYRVTEGVNETESDGNYLDQIIMRKSY